MNTLLEVQFCYSNYENDSNIQYFTIIINSESKEIDEIRQFLFEKNLLQRKDYELGLPSKYEVYVDPLFNLHHLAKFSETVKSVSIIPIIVDKHVPKIVISPNMKYKNKYKPLAINWDDDYTIKNAIESRIHEEFRCSPVKIYNIDIDCEPVDYYNICAPKVQVKRIWTYRVVQLSKSVRGNLKLVDIDEFMKKIFNKVNHFSLGNELHRTLELLSESR